LTPLHRQKYFNDVSVSHFERLAEKRLTNNAEDKAIKEIEAELKKRGISTGVEVNPSYNPLEPFKNSFTYESLTLPDKMAKEY